MQYTLKRVIDTHPEWLNDLKQKCYATNGNRNTIIWTRTEQCTCFKSGFIYVYRF